MSAQDINIHDEIIELDFQVARIQLLLDKIVKKIEFVEISEKENLSINKEALKMVEDNFPHTARNKLSLIYGANYNK